MLLGYIAYYHQLQFWINNVFGSEAVYTKIYSNKSELKKKGFPLKYNLNVLWNYTKKYNLILVHSQNMTCFSKY